MEDDFSSIVTTSTHMYYNSNLLSKTKANVVTKSGHFSTLGEWEWAHLVAQLVWFPFLYKCKTDHVPHINYVLLMEPGRYYAQNVH